MRHEVVYFCFLRVRSFSSRMRFSPCKQQGDVHKYSGRHQNGPFKNKSARKKEKIKQAQRTVWTTSYLIKAEMSSNVLFWTKLFYSAALRFQKGRHSARMVSAPHPLHKYKRCQRPIIHLDFPSAPSTTAAIVGSKPGLARDTRRRVDSTLLYVCACIRAT